MFDYDKLSALISKSGKSKAHLCRAMGKPEYYLRDVLKQKTIIPDDLQIILAAELGTSVEFLNGIEEKEKRDFIEKWKIKNKMKGKKGLERRKLQKELEKYQ